jgi:hypothetical protein
MPQRVTPGVANHDSTHRISVINQTSREAPLPRLLMAVIDRDREPLCERFLMLTLDDRRVRMVRYSARLPHGWRC